MSNIDKQALRDIAAAAESAPLWHAVGVFGEVVDPANPEWKPVHDFCKTFTAERVLALLDELEAAKQDAARWFRSFEKAVSVGARHEERIAELEMREVKLPKPISVLHRRDFMDAHRSIYAYPEAEVNAALADAGINIAAAGKGEAS